MICKNCEHQYTAEDRFCPQCGQATNIKIPTLSELLTDLLSGMYNFDSRFYRTFLHLFIPGRLSQWYIRGKRKKILNPIQLFLLTAIICFAIIQRATKDTMDANTNELIQEMKDEVTAESFLIRLKSDTTSTVPHAYIDTILGELQDTGRQKTGVKLHDKAPDILISDYMNLAIDSLYRKYEITDFWQKLFVSRQQSIIKNGLTVNQFILSKTNWALLIAIPFIALAFKLLYIRRKRYYIEHVVVLLYLHGLFFILMAIGASIKSIGPPIAFGVAFIFLWLTLRYYYRQGWFKSLIKSILLSLIYVLVTSTIIVATAIVGLLMA